MKLTVRFDDAESNFLKDQARRKGLAPSAMCKEIILDRLGRSPVGPRPWEKMAEITKTAPTQRFSSRKRLLYHNHRYKRAVTPALGCRRLKDSKAGGQN